MPDSPNLETLSNAELEAIMDGKAPIPELVPEPESPPVPAPEPAHVESAPPPAESPVEEPPGPTTEELLEDLRSRLEEESLRREKMEALLEHERLLRERANTQAGVFKQAAKNLMIEGRGRFDDYVSSGEGEESAPVSPEVLRLSREVASLREEATTRAANDAMGDFVRSIPDLASDTDASREMLAAMQPLVKRGREDYSGLFDSGDPRLVRDTTKLILKSAYTEVKAQRLASAREQAAAKRVEQFGASRQAKLAASSISSSPVAASAQAPKGLDEMSMDELTAMLDQLAPRGKPRRV